MAAPSESLFSQWLAAGSANALTSALFNPIDAAKTRIQTSTQPESLLRTLRAMAGASTVSAAVRGLFFPGLPASMIREMLSSGPRAGFYVPVRDAYLGALGGAGGDAGAKVLAAMTTGSLGGLIANPIDVVKVRLMIDPTRYSTTLGALRDIGRDEGVGGLYRGLAPSTLRACFIAAGELATYDIAKSNLKERLGSGEGMWLHVAASLITGVVAAFVAAPFDLIKARAMASTGPSKSIVSVVRQLAREGGFPGSLFRGVTPAYLRLGPHALVCFPLFEQIRGLFGLGYL